MPHRILVQGDSALMRPNPTGGVSWPPSALHAPAPRPRQHGLRAVTRAGVWGILPPLPGSDHGSPGSRRHVIPRKHPGEPRSQGRALEPAVLALLEDAVGLPLAQLQLVVLLGLVGVERQVPAGRGR